MKCQTLSVLCSLYRNVGNVGTTIAWFVYNKGKLKNQTLMLSIFFYTAPRSVEDEENIFMQQTLEEFYQRTDSMRPTTRNMSRMSLRAKSAPCKTPSKPPGPAPSSAKQFRQVSKLGHQLLHDQENE